jgi:phosphatidate cytidylyltransferase
MSNFWARTITGLSMVFLILAALYLDRFFFAAIFLAVVILGLFEFYSITVTEECKPQKFTGTLLGTILYVLISGSFLIRVNDPLVFSVVLVLPVFFIPIIIELYRKKEKPLINAAVTIFGLIYVALPVSLLNSMNNPAGGTVFHHFPAYLTAYFLFTWIYDTGAYLVGKNFGKHKFFERISPKKTWEGTIGGTIVVIAATVGFYFITEGILFIHLLALTGLVILFGTFGDLAESLFKRSLNLKDSGNILPGHGGILDRFDTIFVSAPFVFLYFVFQIILYNK